MNGSGPTPTKHPQSQLIQPTNNKSSVLPATTTTQQQQHQISDDEATVRSDSEGDKPKTTIQSNPSTLISNSKVNPSHQHGHHSTTLTNSSHHSHSSNGGSVASVHTHPGGTTHSHHHVSQHHNSTQSSQQSTQGGGGGNNFNRPKMSTQQSQLNPSQMLADTASQKPPSLMRGTIANENNRGIKIIS